MRQKDEGKIQQIFEATLGLVEDYGIGGMSMALIAKRAGIATGTLYIYFSSKEVLFNELYAQIKKDVEKSLQATPLPIHDNYRARVRDLWYRYFQYRLHYYSAIVFEEQCHYSQFLSPENRALSDRITLPIKNLLGEGKISGVLKNMDTEILLMSLRWPIIDLSAAIKQNRIIESPEIIEQVFGNTWDSVSV